MLRYFLFLFLAALSGCGVWSSTIRSDVIDYSDVLETTSNQFLLINILQARDGAPLHFVAIPNLRGSLQATASLTGAVPFEQGVEGTRAAAIAAVGSTPGTPATPAAAFLNGTINPTISVQSSPSFEVDSVEAKDFVTGMSSPIDPKFIKYWVDRGLDKRIILLLFFSSAQITEKIYKTENGHYVWVQKATKEDKTKKDEDNEKGNHRIPCKKGDEYNAEKCEPDVLATQTITIFNSPRDAADQLTACSKQPGNSKDSCHRRTQFEHFLTLVDAIRDDVSANSYSERKTMSDAFELNLPLNLRGLAALDTTKYKLEYQKSKKYALFGISADQNIALCFNHSLAVSDAGDGSQNSDSDDVCTQSIVTKDPVDPDKKKIRDFPVAPDTDDVSYSGDCSTDNKQATDSGNDLDYCAIFSNFLCYTASLWKVSGPGDAERYKTALKASEVVGPGEVCHGDRLSKNSNGAGRIWPADTFTLQFNVRSVAEMIRFLGDLAYYQDTLEAPDGSHNIPVTLGWNNQIHPEGAKSAGRGDCPLQDGGCLFKISEDTGGGRVNVRYRGQSYSIADHQPNDHSLEVLSIVNQLVNLNHSATDLRTTPTVQVVP